MWEKGLSIIELEEGHLPLTRSLSAGDAIHFCFGRLIPNNLTLPLSCSLSFSLFDGITSGARGILHQSATHNPASPPLTGIHPWKTGCGNNRCPSRLGPAVRCPLGFPPPPSRRRSRRQPRLSRACSPAPAAASPAHRGQPPAHLLPWPHEAPSPAYFVPAPSHPLRHPRCARLRALPVSHRLRLRLSRAHRRRRCARGLRQRCVS